MKFTPRNVLAILIVLILVSCGDVKINTSRLVPPSSPVKRIFVVLGVPKSDKQWQDIEASYEKEFSAGISACGATADFFQIPTEEPNLSLEDDTASQRAQLANKIKSFNPNAVLTVQWQSLTTGKYVFAARYSILMKEIPSGNTLWLGQIEANGRGMNDLASAILKEMRKSGILSTCSISNE